MTTNNKELFEELKQRCVNCVNEPNDESIKLLHEFVLKTDKQFINSLYQYSIFPLRLIIANLPKQQNNCENLLISSVDCLSTILQKSSINRFDIFSDIFMNLFHLIDANSHYNNDEKFVIKLNEDLLMSVIKCSKSLVQSCDNAIIGQLISESFRPHLGHSIHILLNIALKEKYSLLKNESILTIICIINKCQLIKTEENCLKTEPEDVIAYFLPGISINISKLISSDDKLNRQLINSCLTLLSNTIVFVFKTISIDSENESKIIDKQINSEDLNNKFIVIRDINWLEKTCDKLIIIFKNIVSCLLTHQNWSTRQSLALFVIEILSNCSQLFVNKCLSILLKVPLTYLNDDFQQIRTECDSFISQFSKHYVNSQSKSCADLIHDEIYVYITQLPRLIRTSSQSEKIAAIHLLYGYLKCLDSNGINDLLYSPQHKEKLFQCFIDICEFDYHGIQLLEQVTNSDNISFLNEEQLPIKWVKKNFSFLEDEKAVKALTKCCHLVGKSSESQLLIDYFIESLRQSNLNPSILFVSNQIISNINGNYDDIKEFIELYLSNINITSRDATIEQMNKNILRQCLLVEGLAAFVKLYDCESSHDYLLKCLFSLLEMCGSSNINVSQSSYMALTQVSTHFGLNSISKLISSNIDYLINSICINLKHFLNNPNVPIVIRVMLKHSNKDTLHHYVDPINEIINVIDCYYRSQAFPLMQVLHSYVCTLSYFYLSNSEVKSETESNQRINFETRAQNVVNSFEEFVNNKKICETLENESNSDKEEEEETEVNDIKKEIPFYVTIVENILERCVHLMSNTDSKVRLIVLDVINHSLRILTTFEDNLLPMAHKLWSPLVERFNDKDVIVIKRAFSCLLIMSQTCGDFIRARTVKEVMPKILSFLKSQSQQSFKKDKASAYRFTVAYQFQIDILSGIGSIAFNLDLREKDLWQIIVEVIPYLNALQPEPLQDSAVVALKKIAELDANSVFYYLKMTFSQTNASHSEKSIFPDIIFGDKKREYEKNVNKLLDELKLN